MLLAFINTNSATSDGDYDQLMTHLPAQPPGVLEEEVVKGHVILEEAEHGVTWPELVQLDEVTQPVLGEARHDVQQAALSISKKYIAIQLF